MGLENFKTNIEIIQNSNTLVLERKKQLLSNFIIDIEYMYLDAPQSQDQQKFSEAQQLIQSIQDYLGVA